MEIDIDLSIKIEKNARNMFEEYIFIDIQLFGEAIRCEVCEKDGLQ